MRPARVRPKVLIFDEAVASLDDEAAVGKVTVLFITHKVPRNLRVGQHIKLGQVLPIEEPNALVA